MNNPCDNSTLYITICNLEALPQFASQFRLHYTCFHRLFLRHREVVSDKNKIPINWVTYVLLKKIETWWPFWKPLLPVTWVFGCFFSDTKGPSILKMVQKFHIRNLSFVKSQSEKQSWSFDIERFSIECLRTIVITKANQKKGKYLTQPIRTPRKNKQTARCAGKRGWPNRDWF